MFGEEQRQKVSSYGAGGDVHILIRMYSHSKKRIMSCVPNRMPPLVYSNARHFSAVQFLCVALILTWLVTAVLHLPKVAKCFF